MFKTLNKSEEFKKVTQDNEAVLLYFSHEQCNVCKVLKPKIIEMKEQKFPDLELYYCDIKKTPEISAQISIFTIPTIVVYLSGKEFFRQSRNIGIDELTRQLSRPYAILFE